MSTSLGIKNIHFSLLFCLVRRRSLLDVGRPAGGTCSGAVSGHEFEKSNSEVRHYIRVQTLMQLCDQAGSDRQPMEPDLDCDSRRELESNIQAMQT